MNHSIQLERALRLLLCVAILGTLLVMPACAVNEYAQKGAQWILDGIYWVGLVVLIWQLVKAIMARNITSIIVIVAVGAIVVALIVRPELFKAIGDRLLSIVGA